MPIVTLLLLLLALVGSLSPLLTLAWLWQVKEWRVDRMLEHLRREGFTKQLWGRARPVIVALHAVTVIVRPDLRSASTIFVLIVMMGLTIAQVLLRRQRYPVPTNKAISVTGTAALLMLMLTSFLISTGWSILPLPFAILLQPLLLGLAWLIWYPVDAVLKARIIAHARSIRDWHPDLTVIGVTGSVGKTTTKELIACVLKDLHPLMTPAYVNSEIGVAQWLIQQLRVTSYGLRETPQPATRNSQPVVIELGAYRKGEIALMTSYVQPTIGVVTHVGTQHIALFGSEQNLFEAKSELVESLPLTGRTFLNGDNKLCRKMATMSPCPVVIVGTGGQCDLEAFDIEETTKGLRFRARDVIFDLSLHGTHNVTNVLLALAVGEYLGVKLERMAELLKSFTPLTQTFSVCEEAGIRILDDTHNSSAASVKAAIAWARTQPEEKKILLAAGLIEMGDHQSPAEQELGALSRTVFERTIVIDAQSARNFNDGGAKNVETFSASTPKVPLNSLLVCTGRMSPSVIRRLLP